MPRVDIPFPRSSQPGQRPGEGQGRLVNCFCEVESGAPTWRPCPGLSSFVGSGLSTPRGAIEVGNLLYWAGENNVVSVSDAGVVTDLGGTLDGTDLVTWARNNNVTPDVAVVTELGAYRISGGAIVAYGDADLPQPNSVCGLDGYLLFTIGDGRVFASDLNATAINALSFGTCQSSPDGLLRGTASGQQFYGWGTSTIEVWQNVGSSPFPLSRVAVIPVGLLARFAIAGWEPGWGLQQIFVASDGTVRRLIGYDPQVISTKDVERAIQSTPNKNDLVACVYIAGGHPFWSLSSNTWTWEYNAATGLWHERQSYGYPYWRARTSIRFGNDWVLGDRLSDRVLTVSELALEDDDLPLVVTLESGPGKQFPSRVRVNSGFFDWTAGQGAATGDADDTDPQVSVSWSHDGGATWGNPLLRALGQRGQYDRQVRVNRCGLASHHGMRWRLVTSSGVYRTFRGGRMDVEERMAA